MHKLGNRASKGTQQSDEWMTECRTETLVYSWIVRSRERTAGKGWQFKEKDTEPNR